MDRQDNSGCSFSIAFSTPQVKGIFRDLCLVPGLCMSCLDAFTDRYPFDFTARINTPTIVEAGFTLNGHLNIDLKGNRHDMSSYPGQGYLSTGHGEIFSTIRIPENQHVRHIEFRYTSDAFDDYACFADINLPENLKCNLGSSAEKFEKCSCIMSPELSSRLCMIYRLVETDIPSFPGLESLCLDSTRDLALILANRIGNSGTVLSSGDIEKVREARHILEKNMEDPPGLLELARMVNLNDYKLKRGFHQAFGTTMHKALTEIRLSRARDLIEKEGFSVSEAALTVGYNNIGDFSIAFRKRFGMPPGRLRLCS